MNARFTEYLRSCGFSIFEAGGTYWRVSRGILIPVPSAPCYVELSDDEATDLLKKSGAKLLFYSSDPCTQETEWWYIVCDSYDWTNLKSKIRTKIRHGMRNCSVRIIDALYLAEHGYECYFNAFNRYTNAIPISKETFYYSTKGSAKGPYEFWGVFVKDQLAGYCQCIIESDVVYTNVTKYHPSYLKYHTSYALVTGMINHYVVGQGITMSNGTRPLSHDTNYQDFLLNLGFRKQFCHLNVEYNQRLKYTIKVLFPLRNLIKLLTNYGSTHKIKSLLFLEELRRTFLL